MFIAFYFCGIATTSGKLHNLCPLQLRNVVRSTELESDFRKPIDCNIPPPSYAQAPSWKPALVVTQFSAWSACVAGKSDVNPGTGGGSGAVCRSGLRLGRDFQPGGRLEQNSHGSSINLLLLVHQSPQCNRPVSSGMGSWVVLLCLPGLLTAQPNTHNSLAAGMQQFTQTFLHNLGEETTVHCFTFTKES